MSGKWLPGIDNGDVSVICRRWFVGVCLDEMVDGGAVTVYVRAGHDAPVESFCVSGFWEPMYSVTLTDGDQHAD